MVLFIFSYEKNEHYLKKTAKNHLKCSSPDNCEPHTPRHISYHLSNYNNKTHTKISTQKAKKKFTRPSFTANPEALACRACFSYFCNSRCANAELHSFFVPRAFPRGPRTSANPPLEAPPRSIFSIVCTIFFIFCFFVRSLTCAQWEILSLRVSASLFVQCLHTRPPNFAIPSRAAEISILNILEIFRLNLDRYQWFNVVFRFIVFIYVCICKYVLKIINVWELILIWMIISFLL